jgi:hypothetical protein
MRLIGFVVVFFMLTPVSLAKKAEKREKKSNPVHTINTFRAKGKSIPFTCSPTNCREQEDRSLLFNLSCRTNNENDELEVGMGDKSQKIQSYGFTDVFEDIKTPKKGFVPIKISVSEKEGLPQTTFTFKYTVEQIKRPSCRKYGDVAL